MNVPLDATLFEASADEELMTIYLRRIGHTVDNRDEPSRPGHAWSAVRDEALNSGHLSLELRLQIVMGIDARSFERDTSLPLRRSRFVPRPIRRSLKHALVRKISSMVGWAPTE